MRSKRRYTETKEEENQQQRRRQQQPEHRDSNSKIYSFSSFIPYSHCVYVCLYTLCVCDTKSILLQCFYSVVSVSKINNNPPPPPTPTHKPIIPYHPFVQPPNGSTMFTFRSKLFSHTLTQTHAYTNTYIIRQMRRKNSLSKAVCAREYVFGS